MKNKMGIMRLLLSVCMLIPMLGMRAQATPGDGETAVINEAVKIQFQGQEFEIDEEFPDEKIPVGFLRTKVLYEGREYMGLKNEMGNMQVLRLKNETRSGFALYDAAEKEFHYFKQIVFESGRYAIPLPLRDDVKSFQNREKTVVTIANLPFEAWKLSEEYSVICAMNADGKIELYQYDSIDQTLQRFGGDIVIQVTNEDKDKEPAPTSGIQEFLSKYHLYLLAGLVIALLCVTVGFVCYAATRESNGLIASKPARRRSSRKHRGRRRKRRKEDNIE